MAFKNVQLFFKKKSREKIAKKNPQQVKRIGIKIKEIICSENIDHYKNLRQPLHKYKRVHIDSSFVLIFSVMKNKKEIIFEDFEHHDSIYNK